MIDSLAVALMPADAVIDPVGVQDVVAVSSTDASASQYPSVVANCAPESDSPVGVGVPDHVVVTVAVALSLARAFRALSTVWVPMVPRVGPAPVRVVFVALTAFTKVVPAGHSVMMTLMG